MADSVFRIESTGVILFPCRKGDEEVLLRRTRTRTHVHDSLRAGTDKGKR